MTTTDDGTITTLNDIVINPWPLEHDYVVEVEVDETMGWIRYPFSQSSYPAAREFIDHALEHGIDKAENATGVHYFYPAHRIRRVRLLRS